MRTCRDLYKHYIDQWEWNCDSEDGLSRRYFTYLILPKMRYRRYYSEPSFRATLRESRARARKNPRQNCSGAHFNIHPRLR